MFCLTAAAGAQRDIHVSGSFTADLDGRLLPVLVFRLPVVAAGVHAAENLPAAASEADMQPQFPATPMGSRQLTIGAAGRASVPGGSGDVSEAPVPPEDASMVRVEIEPAEVVITSAPHQMAGTLEPVQVGGH